MNINSIICIISLTFSIICLIVNIKRYYELKKSLKNFEKRLKNSGQNQKIEIK